MKRHLRFAPVVLFLAVAAFMFRGVFAQAVPTHQCQDNVPGFALRYADNGDGMTILVCSPEQPYVDGVAMSALPTNPSVTASHEAVVLAGTHVLTTTTTSLSFTTYRFETEGEGIAYDAMSVLVGEFEIPLNVVTYSSADGLRNMMNVAGSGFALNGVQEYWRWASNTWETTPDWSESSPYLFSTLIPQASNCTYPVPSEPFAWALENGHVGVCADDEDLPPHVNGLALTPESDPDTPFNWVSETPLTGTLTITTSGSIAAATIGKTVIAEQEYLAPGESSQTLLNITAVDNPVTVLHYTQALQVSPVDETFAVWGYGYDHGGTAKYANWYYNQPGWEETPVWVPYMIMGLEQTQWDVFLPISLNQKDCAGFTPEPSAVYVDGVLGICANNQPVLDGTPMSGESGEYWNYSSPTTAGPHSLVINNVAYPLLVDAQGDFDDGTVSVFGGTLEGVTRLSSGNSNVYSIRGYGWSLDLPWGSYTLKYYNPGTDSWRCETPDEWTNTTWIQVTPGLGCTTPFSVEHGTP